MIHKLPTPREETGSKGTHNWARFFFVRMYKVLLELSGNRRQWKY